VPFAFALVALAGAPAAFEQNQGAFDAPARFVARCSTLDVFLLPGEVRLALRGAHGARVGLSLGFEGADNAVPEGLDPLGLTQNRFVGPPSRWSAAAPLFARAQYRDIFPGIDAVLHTSGRELELDFALAAFADERAIRLRPHGARIVEMTPSRVLLQAAGERVELRAPRASQDGRPVAARYVKRADGAIGLSLGPHDRARPVVVDPVVATLFGYLGGSDDDVANAVALDDAGFVIIAGNTQSADFPQVLGVQTFGGGEDVFVTKLNARDGGLVYSTFIGGSQSDTAAAVALEADGTAVVVGTTFSADFPNSVPARAYDGGGIPEAFAVRVAPQGGALIGATYLGGAMLDEARSVAIDPSGAAWVAGDTFSPVFRGFAGATQLFSQNANTRDGFVARLLPDAGATFLAYLGGTGGDYVYGVAVRSDGLVYAAGSTASTDFPLMNEAQEHSDGGAEDGFIVSLRDTPPGLVMSTYFGGPLRDWFTGIALTADGGVVAQGFTVTTNLPFYKPWQQLHHVTSTFDTFVARFNGQPQLSLQWLGIVGGDRNDSPGGVAVDAHDVVYLAASGASTLTSLTPMALEMSPPAGSNGYLAVIDPAGTQFIYLTYVGGSGDDALNALAARDGLVAMAGQTNSTDLPVRGPLATFHPDGGAHDVMLVTLTIPAPRIDAVTPDAGPLAGGARVDIAGDFFLPDASVLFGALPGQLLTLQQTQLSVVTPAAPPGPVDVTVVNADGQRATVPGAFVYVGGLPPVARVTPPSQRVDAGDPVLIDGSGSSGDSALSFAWTQVQGPTAVDFDGGMALSFTPPLAGSYAFDLVVTDLEGRASPAARAAVTANAEAAPLPPFHPGCSCASTDAAALLVALLLALKGWSRSR
jgi:hypothetical protein